MMRRKSAFLINFWLESEAEHAQAPALWRGSIEHLPTGRRLYFNEIASLVGFLTTYLRTSLTE